jgi:hypothetical protein
MARYVFGKAISDDDVMLVQGVEYHMQPIGMRALRSMLSKREMLQAAEANGQPRGEQLDSLMEIIVASVVPAERDRLHEQLEETGDIALITEMSTVLLRGQADMDPTQPTSSSAGSSPTGATSTDGAAPTASIPSPSLSDGY